MDPLITALALVLGSSGAAPDYGIELAWAAPPECPDAARAGAILREQLHGEGLTRGDAHARVAIVAGADGWTATIEIEAGEPFAARTLVAADCEALARAAVLVVAVAIDPVAVVGEVDAIDALEGPATAANVVPPPLPDLGGDPTGSDEALAPAPTSVRPRVRERDRPSSHALRIGGGVGLQVVPAIGGVVHLAYVLGRPRWRIEAIASYQPPVDRFYPRVATDDDAGGRIAVLSFVVRACPTPRIGRVTFPICLGLESGPVFGRGLGVARRERATSGWLAVQAGLGLVVRVHRVVGIALGTELLATLARPAFHLGTRERLFDVPPVGARAVIGLELRLR